MKIPELNYDKMTVYSNGKHSHLTPKEFDILEFLINNPRKTFTSDEIYKTIWKSNPYQTSGIIAVHLCHIREKIEADPSRPLLIKSMWGRGYQFTGL